MQQVSALLVPTLMLLIIGYGLFKKVNVYQAFIQGAKAGLESGVQILPVLVAMMIATGMLRASGVVQWLETLLTPFFSMVGIPPQTSELIILRPFSGSASLSVLTDILERQGPDSMAGCVASVMMGSTETLLYTLSVYYGAVGIKRTKHTIPAAVFSMIIGVFAAAWVCQWLF